MIQRFLVLGALFLLATCSSFAASKYKFEALVNKEEVIWGFDFLPDGSIIYTERAGKMFTYDPKSKVNKEVTGVPAVYSAGQGGLLDIRLHPDFPKNHLIYFTYSEPVDKLSTTAFMMAKLENNKLTEQKKIFSGYKPGEEDVHYGSRIEFDDKGHVFITMGERGERDRAQDLAYHQGKIMRFMLDGSVPKDNPFLKTKDARPEIWSLGHRSPQGLVRHPVTGELWEAEMGPRGGDEINLIEEGKNYGWPVITYGREYYGPKIGTTAKAGMEQPISYWVPSISPSGMAFYTGDKIPGWKNNLFLATLSGNHVHRLVMEGKKVVEQEELLKDLGYRWRCVRNGPDGHLYLSTDEGKLGRIIQNK